MITVYKYPFDVADEVTIDLPRGAEILKVETQGGQPCLWALVDSARATEPRRFTVVGTGHPLNHARMMASSHVASFQQGPFVWHMFEVKGRAVDR